MRILFFSHYFPPEGNAPATRTYENCKRWVEMGHEVTVVTCAPNCPTGIVYEGFRNKIFQREEVEGIHVIRVWTYMAANKGTIKRIANYVSYMISAFVASFSVKKPDILIATSPQFFCGWTGVLVKFFKRVPFVLEIRDLWPDSIAAVGAMRQSFLLRLLYRMEGWMYKAASHIVTVGDGYREELQKKEIPLDKITVITNGVDPSHYLPRDPELSLKKKLGLSQSFVCSYVGTIGMACGLHVVLECASSLQEQGRNDIALALIGDGAIREELEQQAKERKLTNIIFTGRLAKELMPHVLSFSDACLVHLRKTDLFRTVLPSKIFEAASMERPILLGVEGNSADLVRRAEAGICIEPENAEQLTQAILRLADEPSLGRKMGKNGRRYIQEHFDRAQLADRYLSLLEQLVPPPTQTSFVQQGIQKS